MVVIRRVIVVLSAIWLIAVFSFLISLDAGTWGEFILVYSVLAVIPVILLNGLLWLFKGSSRYL